MINCSEKISKEETYIALIDIEEAFEDTWREGMFYNLWQRRLRGKIWKVMYNLYQDQVTAINTKYEPTKKIESENGIREGKVLVDEVEVELKDFV